MNEKRAIKLCLHHRDPAGFEFLVNQYRREAFHHAYALLGNLEDAADACQDSFLKAFAAMPQLRKLTAFYPWFYRILRNSCLNTLSRRHTAARYRESRMDGRKAGEGREIVDPSMLMEQREEAKQVWAVLQGLKPDHKEILAMKYIQGLSYENISALLNCPRGTVMSRLYLARKAFRAELTVMTPNPDNTFDSKEMNP